MDQKSLKTYIKDQLRVFIKSYKEDNDTESLAIFKELIVDNVKQVQNDPKFVAEILHDLKSVMGIKPVEKTVKIKVQ